MRKTCLVSGEPFEVSERDLEFYKRVSPTFDGERCEIPPPTLSPLCRAQRRMVWRAELNLFLRESVLSGKKLLVGVPPESYAKVIHRDEFWSDDFDPLSYGRDFDFSRPFFEQWKELAQEVPVMGLTAFENENSDFINNASYNKNCYLIAGANHNESCYYGNYVNNSNFCVDVSFIDKCELCYECVDCTGCYNVRYAVNSHNCSDSTFLRNCRGCKNCFGCVNLANKQYNYFNQQLTKDEYLEALQAHDLGVRSEVSRLRDKFERFRLDFPYKYMIGEMNDDVTGNSIFSSHSSHHCFDVSEVWDCYHCSWFHQSKDCMDCFSWGFPAELCYECVEVGGGSYGSAFSVTVVNSENIYYSYHTYNSKHCFGCVSLKKNKYCIFNKQYSWEDYEKLALRIVGHMKETGEWGELFPMSLTALCYNASVAQDYQPIDKEMAEMLNVPWHDESKVTKQPSKHVHIPDSIDEVDESICGEVLTCSETGRAFKITRPELAFYKKHRVALPDVAFIPRHRARLAKRNPRALWERSCEKCGVEIQTSYPPQAPETVYCGDCYLNEIY